MNEELFQYIWMSGLFNANGLKTKEGEDVIIYLRGKLNQDSGPDFKNARIRIGDTEWVGNVELHIHSDEWYQHKHHLDKAYNSTILHVVLENNRECLREDGTVLSCIELKEKIPADLIKKYASLKQNGTWIPCEEIISRIDHFTIRQSLNRSMLQRLERKSIQVEAWLKQSNNHWNSVFYFALARSFGFGTNSDAYEQLAINLPFKILSKHRQNSKQTEALIFGVAGFLDDGASEDAYFTQLKTEWDFLRVKYQLRAMDKSAFKFMRMRPGNFPGIKLAQFAALAVKSDDIFESLNRELTVEDIRRLFRSEADEYWKSHYHFSKSSVAHGAALSMNAIHIILINAYVPVMFVYGKQTNNRTLCDRALTILESTPAENNQIIRHWKTLGLHAVNAFDSQALLELKKQNCDEKKCLKCIIGNKVMNMKDGA